MAMEKMDIRNLETEEEISYMVRIISRAEYGCKTVRRGNTTSKYIARNIRESATQISQHGGKFTTFDHIYRQWHSNTGGQGGNNGRLEV